MGLLEEIQKDALSEATQVSTLLRKVLVLASHLDSGVLEDWVRHELNGYPEEIEVPVYRKMGLSFKASVRNLTMHHHAYPVPPYLVQKATNRHDITTFHCRQPIGTISSLLDNDSDTLQVNFDNVAVLIQRELERGNAVLGFWGELPTALMIGVLDAVRTRVLDFTLTLKKAYPNAGDVGGSSVATPEMERAAATIYYTTIHGNNAGLIGNAERSTINMSVMQGDVADLRQKLAALGIDAADIADLEKVLSEEPSAGQNGKLGPKVAGWMGRMLGKAAEGVWTVGLDTGARVLEKALKSYFGVDG